MTIDLPLKPDQVPRFELGTVVGTPGSVAALYSAKVDPLTLIVRHVTGDWGDLCVEDKQANENALRHGARLFSKYDLDAGDPPSSVYVITEWDRSVTTILCPDEY